MRTRAAVVMEAPGPYEVIEVELDEPRQGELLVRMKAAGLCHSDDHVATGDHVVETYPWCGGHEGAGIVERVGPNTPGWAPGDHVVFSFVASCGRCRWCSSGMQNLCDFGATALIGSRFDDPSSFRVRTLDGLNVGQMCGLGTFAEYTLVSERSALRVDKDLSFETLSLFGCSVGTGWGSAVYSADVRPGDTAIVMGIGGVGIHAVQGALHAGAQNVIAVDPVAYKREVAAQFGARFVCESVAEAAEISRGLTEGQGADAAIVTVGVTTPEHLAQAFEAVRKGGVVVATGHGPWSAVGIPIQPAVLTAFQKRLVGSHFGGCNPGADIPRLVSMYRSGTLRADELVTKTYSLDDIAAGYSDMHAGKNMRGVVVF